jgi:TonB family protein
LVIGPDKTATAGPGIPGLPPIPGGNTGDGSPLSGYDYYRAWALYKIQPNFNIPRYLKAEGITCLVHFTVLRDGRIVNIRVLRSTNDPILDGLAVRALEATASLPPLPDTFKEDQVELNVLFDYSPSVEQGGSVNP